MTIDPAGSMDPAAEVRGWLADPALATRLADLGLSDDDQTDALVAATRVVQSPSDVAVVAALVERLRHRVGDFRPSEPNFWAASASPRQTVPDGVLPLLALALSAPAVAAFHARRGIPDAVSVATLAELGQQVAVHRLTYGGFGLHTQDWLTLPWSGALYWLGRLQFNLHRDVDDRWVLSTHIPRTGPLTPESVDASFAAGAAFFAEHFPDHPTTAFYCESWLLDPELPVLLPDSHLAAFQRRWTLDDHVRPGLEDLLFFAFLRRGSVDLDQLPTNTTLRRAFVARLRSGGSWTVRRGRIRHTAGGGTVLR